MRREGGGESEGVSQWGKKADNVWYHQVSFADETSRREEEGGKKEDSCN